MGETPKAPNILTVVFHDDGATRWVGTPPTSRSVRVMLTAEQIERLRFRGDCESITVAVVEHDPEASHQKLKEGNRV